METEVMRADNGLMLLFFIILVVLSSLPELLKKLTDKSSPAQPTDADEDEFAWPEELLQRSEPTASPGSVDESTQNKPSVEEWERRRQETQRRLYAGTAREPGQVQESDRTPTVQPPATRTVSLHRSGTSAGQTTRSYTRAPSQTKRPEPVEPVRRLREQIVSQVRRQVQSLPNVGREVKRELEEASKRLEQEARAGDRRAIERLKAIRDELRVKAEAQQKSGGAPPPVAAGPLLSSANLRQAILTHEVLMPPVALRPRSSSFRSTR